MQDFIPPNFPRREYLGALAGVHPKALVREVHGKFVATPTDDEIQALHDVCTDLVMQLETYCRRKLCEDPSMDRLTVLRKIRIAVAKKRWDLSDAEFDWVMERLGLSVCAKKVSLVPLQAAPPWVEKALEGETTIATIKTRIQAVQEKTLERLAAVRHGPNSR